MIHFFSTLALLGARPALSPLWLAKSGWVGFAVALSVAPGWLSLLSRVNRLGLEAAEPGEFASVARKRFNCCAIVCWNCGEPAACVSGAEGAGTTPPPIRWDTRLEETGVLGKDGGLDIVGAGGNVAPPLLEPIVCGAGCHCFVPINSLCFWICCSATICAATCAGDMFIVFKEGAGGTVGFSNNADETLGVFWIVADETKPGFADEGGKGGPETVFGFDCGSRNCRSTSRRASTRPLQSASDSRCINNFSSCSYKTLNTINTENKWRKRTAEAPEVVIWFWRCTASRTSFTNGSIHLYNHFQKHFWFQNRMKGAIRRNELWFFRDHDLGFVQDVKRQ